MIPTPINSEHILKITNYFVRTREFKAPFSPFRSVHFSTLFLLRGSKKNASGSIGSERAQSANVSHIPARQRDPALPPTSSHRTPLTLRQRTDRRLPPVTTTSRRPSHGTHSNSLSSRLRSSRACRRATLHEPLLLQGPSNLQPRYLYGLLDLKRANGQHRTFGFVQHLIPGASSPFPHGDVCAKPASPRNARQVEPALVWVTLPSVVAVRLVIDHGNRHISRPFWRRPVASAPRPHPQFASAGYYPRSTGCG